MVLDVHQLGSLDGQQPRRRRRAPGGGCRTGAQRAARAHGVSLEFPGGGELPLCLTPERSPPAVPGRRVTDVSNPQLAAPICGVHGHLLVLVVVVRIDAGSVDTLVLRLDAGSRSGSHSGSRSESRSGSSSGSRSGSCSSRSTRACAVRADLVDKGVGASSCARRLLPHGPLSDGVGAKCKRCARVDLGHADSSGMPGCGL